MHSARPQKLNRQESRRCTEIAAAFWEKEAISMAALSQQSTQRNKFWRMLRGERLWEVNVANRILAQVAEGLEIPFTDVWHHVLGRKTQSSPLLIQFARSRHWSPTERNGKRMARLIEDQEGKCLSLTSFRRVLPISLMPDDMRQGYFRGLAEQMEIDLRVLRRQLTPYARARRQHRIEQAKGIADGYLRRMADRMGITPAALCREFSPWGAPARRHFEVNNAPQLRFVMLQSDFDRMQFAEPPFHYCTEEQIAECLHELYYFWIQTNSYIFCIIPDEDVPPEVLGHYSKYESVTFFQDRFSVIRYRDSLMRRHLFHGQDQAVAEAFDREGLRLEQLLDCMPWQPWPMKHQAFEMFLLQLHDRMLGLTLDIWWKEGEVE